MSSADIALVIIVYRVPKHGGLLTTPLELSSSESWENVRARLLSIMGYKEDNDFWLAYWLSNGNKTDHNALEEEGKYQGLVDWFEKREVNKRANAADVHVNIVDVLHDVR